MRFYLSSIGIPEIHAFEEFVEKKAKDIKFCLIYNAMDYKPATVRAQWLNETITTLNEQGIRKVIELNLHDYDGPAKLKSDLEKYDVIWLNGGNVYLLRWLLKKSGFDEIIDGVLQKEIVLAGDSAGTIVIGPTLKYYNAADDPKEAGGVIWKGLNLINIAMLPHWGSEKFQPVLGGIEDNLKASGYTTKRLADGEFITIESP